MFRNFLLLTTVVPFAALVVRSISNERVRLQVSWLFAGGCLMIPYALHMPVDISSWVKFLYAALCVHFVLRTFDMFVAQRVSIKYGWK